MRVKKKTISDDDKYTSKSLITKMQAIITANNNREVDFYFLRENLPELDSAPDGVVHQAVIDAGFEVEV